MALFLYGASIFTSAFLLFLVQPMIAKLGLPLFGGSPAVWTTCLVFFQTLLLGGYAYAHASGRVLGTRRQMIVHAGVLLAPLLALPPALSMSAAPEPGAWPVPALVRALALSVGLPFFALSTNGTLAQRWYALRSGREPYFLYAASNAGSFLALIAYPFLLEPRIDLAAQARIFSIGYGVFVVLTMTSMALAWRAAGRAAGPSVESGPAPEAATKSVATPAAAPSEVGGPLGWTLRAMVPSILLMAISLRITTDVGAVPLFWVVPLALYLLTFILAFTPRFGRLPRALLAVPTVLLVIVLLGYPTISNEGLWTMSLLLGVLFFGSWLCHADLARSRPAPDRLTAFYLWISVGGALGSLLTNIVAPLVFSSVAEFPLSLALLAVVTAVPRRLDRTAVARTLRAPGFIGATLAILSLVALWAFLSRGTQRSSLSGFATHLPTFTLGAALLAGFVRARAIAAELCVAALAIALLLVPGTRRSGQQVLHTQRSFFGTLKVTQIGTWRSLVHGTTNHGMERVSPPDGPPTMYYHPTSPMAWSVTNAPDGPLAVVGLGTGTLARLIRPTQSLTYYEIDKIVEPIARTWFSFVPKAKGPVRVVLGDARLSLKDASEPYSMILVDAFTSDAIPVHLLTEEAVRLYLSKLKPDGIVYFHISNRYLDLMPVLRSHAAELGLFGASNHYVPDEEAEDEGASATDVVALTASRAALDKLLAAKWVELDKTKRKVRWTDARSSLIPVLKLRRPATD
jgi:SAM-dependent methyltransferase